MTMEILTTHDAAAWQQILQQCGRYDFYHLAQYHALAEQAGEGIAKLFVWREDGFSIALPLLLRPLDGMPGAAPGWHDATSVYGYAGPLTSAADVPERIIANFQEALLRRLKEQQVVTLFTRLNAFLPQARLLAGLGECQAIQQTVSIDLTQPLPVQRAAYRSSNKVGINKLRRLGLTCVHDRDGTHLDEFVAIYHETMRRVDAQDEYFFPAAYFKQLMTDVPANSSLFVCLQDGKAICGGLFIECCGVLQYHLGGTRSDALKLGPMRLLVDDVRTWATEQGYRVLHLGGGISTSPQDSLLHFKIGFSNCLHDFTVWRWIVAPDAYRRLCDEKARANEVRRLQDAKSGYFPAYRCPVVPYRDPAVLPVRIDAASQPTCLTPGGTP